MSNHILLRRGREVIPTEMPDMGEPRWDPEKSAFGVFNNIDEVIEWLPRTYGEVVQMFANKFLTGETASGEDNNVYLDWSVPNELRLRNKVTGVIYARFTNDGCYFLNPVAAATAEVGISNRALNGNLAVKFGTNAPTYPLSTTTLVSGVMVAPNWMLWKGAGSSGAMSVAYDETDKPPGAERSFLIQANGAPNKSGLRNYIFDYGIVRNREIVIYGDFKGPTGRTVCMRVSNAQGEIYMHEFTLGPLWTQHYFSVNAPDVDGDFLAVDFIYNPSRTNPSLITFRGARFGISIGQTPPRYEARSVEMEKSLMSSVYKEGSIFVNGTAVGSLDLGLTPGTHLDIDAKSTAGEVTVSQANSLGAAASIIGASGVQRINYRASSVIRTAETN